ncbi:hypothetical protein QBD00_004695 [Ochrobactrum sp. AN78]|nr:hypothetical protein [Ochrobactrum sp. AN78]
MLPQSGNAIGKGLANKSALLEVGADGDNTTACLVLSCFCWVVSKQRRIRPLGKIEDQTTHFSGITIV